MTDINKITHPSGPPEPSGKQRIKDPDADKFKREMDYKVHETDPEQQGKKKKQTDQEEEEPINPILNKEPDAPTGTFSLDPSQKSSSPFDLQSGTGKTSPLGSSSSAPPPPPQQNIFTPSIPLNPNVEEEDFGISENPPLSSSQEASSSFSSDSPPSSFTEGEQTQAPPPSSQNQNSPSSSDQNPSSSKQTEDVAKKRKEELSLASGDDLKVKQQEKPQPDLSPLVDLPPSDIKKLSAEELLKTASPSEKGIGSVKEGKPLSPTTAPIKGKKTEEEELSSLLTPPEGLIPTQTSNETPPPLAPSPYARLTPHIMEIFEKMVGVITVLQISGKTETTLTLNSSQYAGSKFFGTKISIQTDRNAPGSFNIKLEASPEAKTTLDGASKDLMAAFQYGNYNFRVQRLDISLLQEERTDIVHRKEDASGDSQDSKEEN